MEIHDMVVTTINAKATASRSIQDGVYNIVELGATATITADQDWQACQRTLLQALKAQVRATCTEPLAGPVKPPNGHFCDQHQTQFYQHTSGTGQVWYSHKIGETDEWCREPQQKKGGN